MENLFDYKEFLNKANKINEEFEGTSNEMTKFLPMVDYTELSHDLPDGHIEEVCKKADSLGVATVCVQPENVNKSKYALKGSNVGVCTVVSFPEGTNSLEEKIAECKKVISDGADEVDMVLNWKELKNLDEEYFEKGVEEVKSLADVCHDAGLILKVIVESSELSEEQTKIATEICMKAGADFIKTSTGFAPNGIGAELSKIKVMFNTIKESGSNMKIKSSGGIKDINKVKSFAPYVDRFGIGYKSVDSMLMGEASKTSY